MAKEFFNNRDERKYVCMDRSVTFRWPVIEEINKAVVLENVEASCAWHTSGGEARNLAQQNRDDN